MKNKEILLAKGLSFPLNQSITISKTDTEIKIKSNASKQTLSLPFNMPFAIGKKETVESIKNGFSLPFNMPFSLGQESIKPPKPTTYGLGMPFSLPFGIGEVSTEGGRRTIINNYKLQEKAWVFQGIVFDENIVALMKAQLLLMEEVKSRVLVDLSLIDKNHVKLKWYGSQVDTVQVFKKLDIDERYEADGDPIDWETGEVTIAIGDGSYNIILKGPAGSGESGRIDISDTSANKILSDLKIALNEKTYFLTTDLKETHKIKINF